MPLSYFGDPSAMKTLPSNLAIAASLSQEAAKGGGGWTSLMLPVSSYPALRVR